MVDIMVGVTICIMVSILVSIMVSVTISIIVSVRVTFMIAMMVKLITRCGCSYRRSVEHLQVAMEQLLQQSTASQSELSALEEAVSRTSHTFHSSPIPSHSYV